MIVALFAKGRGAFCTCEICQQLVKACMIAFNTRARVGQNRKPTGGVMIPEEDGVLNSSKRRSIYRLIQGFLTAADCFRRLGRVQGEIAKLLDQYVSRPAVPIPGRICSRVGFVQTESLIRVRVLSAERVNMSFRFTVPLV